MLEYHPHGHYVNDFTVIKKDGLFHLFHITGERLKMSGGLTDLPKQGHAVSRDLAHWKERPFATKLGGACSVVKHGGRYALVENVKRICWSKNLDRWTEPAPISFDFARRGVPYETEWVKESARYNSHRDPNIHWDPERKVYVMFFCSRVKPGLEPDMFRRGCIGLAESDDLVHWRVCPPALPPGRHLFPESPHVIDLDGKYHLFFTLSPENGLRHAVADTLRGPYSEIEQRDILPGYVGASETVRTEKGWRFLGRLQDRSERCNQSRLAPRALCLPLAVRARADRSIAFRALPVLDAFRGRCLFDSRRQNLADHWQVLSGDWRVNRSRAMAANRHEPIPPNSLFGSSSIHPARLRFGKPAADLDLEFNLQLPTFNGNDAQFRAWLVVDGVRFSFCSLLKAVVCQDASGDILAQAPLPDLKLDRYYHVRLFRCDGITQLYLDDDLLMYLSAYGDAGGGVEFLVDHADLIVTDIRLWELKPPSPAGWTVEDPRGKTINGIAF